MHIMQALRSSGAYLQTVVSDDAEKGDDGVHNGQDPQGRLHVSTALLQDKVHRDWLGGFPALLWSPAVVLVQRGPIQSGLAAGIQHLFLLHHRRGLGHLGSGVYNSMNQIWSCCGI